MQTTWFKFLSEHVATILVGDLNVHHARWLRCSSNTTVESTTLHKFRFANGLKQLVKRQTRGYHLLDLVMSDLQARAVDVLPAILDHHMVLANFDIGISESTLITHSVFEYSKADCANIKHDLA